jgi:hypothetical protein
MGIPKRFNDLTQDELFNLTKDGIQRLIDLECAFEGLVKVDMPTKPINPNEELTKPAIAYGISGILLTDYAEAEKVLALKSIVKTNYNWELGYHMEWLSPDEVSLTTKMYYLEADVRAAAKELKAFKALKDLYETELAEYNKFVKAYDAIVNLVMDAMYKAKLYFYSLEKATKLFNEYMGLAGGDTTIAVGFFKKTDFIDSIKERVFLAAGVDVIKEVENA